MPKQTKKKIELLNNYSNYQEPKFLFGNADRSYLTIVTVRDMVGESGIGTPVVPDGYEDEGDDCELIGQIDSSWDTGDIDAGDFTL